MLFDCGAAVLGRRSAFLASGGGTGPAPMIHAERWRAGRRERLFERLAYPLVYLLNRPRLAGAGRLLYDLALRCNGIGIAYPGSAGLTRPEERFLRAAAPQLQGGLVLDVGANAGAYAAFVRSLAADATIAAFEPHPRTIRQLREAAAHHRFEALQLAVGETAGTAVLHDFADADGSTQASLDAEAVRLHGGGPTVAHTVECVRLDEYAASRGWGRIALLKIDTEGFDLAVLRGAARLLAERRIGMIQFEFIPANIVRAVTMRDFYEALPGYVIHRVCVNGALLPMPDYSVKGCEIFVTQTLVALPVAAAA